MIRPALRLLGFLALATLANPGANAREVDAGPVHLETGAQDMEECDVPLDEETCLLIWQQNGTESLADDHLEPGSAPPWVSATVDSAILIAPSDFRLDGHDFTIEHDVNHQLNATWLNANDSLPGFLRGFVTLESRPLFLDKANSPWAIVVVVHSPAPLPAEGLKAATASMGDSWVSAGYSWECRTYFGNDHNWDDFCTYDYVRPYPPGTSYATSTDFWLDYAAGATDCPGVTPERPYCAFTVLVHEEAEAAVSAWKTTMPNLGVGTDVDHLSLDLAPARAPFQTPRPSVDAPHRGALHEVRSTVQGQPADPVSTRVDPPPLPGPTSVPGGGKGGSLLAAKGQSTYATSKGGEWSPIMTAAALAAGGLLLLAALLLLYHRTRQDATLENQNRLRIYEAIRDEPGIRAGTLRTRLGLGYQTVLWHLKILEEFHMVEGLGEGQRRFFVNGGSFNAQEKRAIMITTTPAARAIFDLVQERGETPFSALSEALHISNSTASETVGRLEQAGLLVKRRVNGRLLVGLGPVSGEFRKSFA